jgi:NAD(P)H-dependent FMN reductase
MPTLMIILGSTRPGRGGEAVANWFRTVAEEHTGFEVDFVDLAEVGLPLLDEPNHPRLREYTKAHTKRWSERVDAADAFVLVLPEYNHSFNAALKNALDFLHHEWKHKPVGFVSYGGVSAGTRAQTALKVVVGALEMLPITAAVNIPFYRQFVDDEERLQPNDVMAQAASTLLDELVRSERALRALRVEPVA